MAKNRESRNAETLKLVGFVLALLGSGTAFGGMPGNPLWFSLTTGSVSLAGIVVCVYGFVMHARAKARNETSDHSNELENGDG